MPNLGMSIIALPLEQGKLFLYLIIWIGIYGKVLPHVLLISKIISSIITGIWFWNWGTGEALNNGTHFVDILRWGLGVDYPTKVDSIGGRYRFQDAGKLLTHNLSPSNLVTKHLFHGKDVVVIRCR